MQARMADSVADGVGVNTHINYAGSVYNSGYESIIKPRLLESGIRHIRDNSSGDSKVIERYGELADKGIRLLLINNKANSSGLDFIKRVNTRASRPVEMVEPPNERDCNDDNWATLLRDFQPAFWNLLKSDAATREIPLLGPSFCNSSASPDRLSKVAPGMGAYMDAGNIHDYSGEAPELELGGGWGLSPDRMLEKYRQLSGAKPIVSTENGYKMSGATEGHPTVSQLAAAKYLPRMFLDRIGRGVYRTYIYQLINNAEDFGLLNENGSPRAQFLAVKNMVHLFSDKGAKFQPGRLDVAISGDTSKVKMMLFQKRSGQFYLVLWQAVKSYDPESGKDLQPEARRIEVKLGSRFKSIKSHTPSLSTDVTSIPAPLEGLAEFSLSVPDHILVVELGEQVGGNGIGIRHSNQTLRDQGFRFQLGPSGLALSLSRNVDFRMEIHSFTGRLIGSFQGNRAGNYSLHAKDLQPGIFWLTGTCEGRSFTSSLLIGH